MFGKVNPAPAVSISIRMVFWSFLEPLKLLETNKNNPKTWDSWILFCLLFLASIGPLSGPIGSPFGSFRVGTNPWKFVKLIVRFAPFGLFRIPCLFYVCSGTNGRELPGDFHENLKKLESSLVVRCVSGLYLLTNQLIHELNNESNK